MPTHTIYCFGVARDLTGAGSVKLDLPTTATVADLRAALLDRYPAFGELVSFAIARNEAYAEGTEVLEPGDELAVIPPVSGG